MEETAGLDESLKDYKAQIPILSKGSLTLDRDLVFVARTQRGYEFEFDPDLQWGCSPTETLMMSLAGCLAIDVVSFLRKMRAEVTAFKIDVSGERYPNPPQYYKSIRLVLNITGKELTPKKVERAISLSEGKYCSVRHSLRQDTNITVEYNIITE